jgi:hypothetical protein
VLYYLLAAHPRCGHPKPRAGLLDPLTLAPNRAPWFTISKR